jgi:hypothetical protein
MALRTYFQRKDHDGLLRFRAFFADIRRSINDPNHVTVQRQRLCGGFQHLRAHILLAPCIGPLQSCGDQFHQIVHDHTTAFLRIEQRMSEPGVDAPGPLRLTFDD